jgi:hypothetical protein
MYVASGRQSTASARSNCSLTAVVIRNMLIFILSGQLLLQSTNIFEAILPFELLKY